MREEREIINDLEHSVTLESRSKLTVSGVTDVGSYDDVSAIVYTSMGQMSIRGEGLKISKLNTDFGELIITGRIFGVVYTDDREKTGLFGRLLK